MSTDWDSIMREIERGNCVFVLGHGLIPDANGSPMYYSFCDTLATEMNDLIYTYYPEENFFLFKAPKNRRKFTNRIDDFYTGLQPDAELYQMLSEIPVSLYVSVSPDNFLEKALGENATVAFFNDPQKRGMETEPTREQPLLYHLFGSNRDSSSLLLSHDDLFDFVRNVFVGQGLPKAVKNFFKEDAGGEVIFLGFAFKKWYVQLLLRLFNLSKTDNELSRTAYLNSIPMDDEKNFASQHFQVDFIETHIKEFVTTLHQKCKEKGILRQLKDINKEVANLSAEEKRQRIAELQQELLNCTRLRNEYEEKQLLSDDPRERMKCETEIKKLEERIAQIRVELRRLGS